MARSDRDRAYHRWRVEHARNPNTDSTPRSAAADTAGEVLLSQKLAYDAIQIVKEHSSTLALKLTGQSGAFETFGDILLELVDMDQIPSRMEIHRRLIDEEIVEPDALVSDKIESRRREFLLEQLGDEEIIAVAVTLCQGERDSYDSDSSMMIEECKENIEEIRAEKGLRRVGSIG